MSPLFTSAFLAELYQEKKLKMTHMRVGSSPVYYLDGQEEGLEKYSTYLKSKEKEAYELLKKNRFLKDAEQEPAIRVALRAIKDFAIPTKENQIWKYYLEKEENLPQENIEEKIAVTPTEEKTNEIKEAKVISKEEPKENSEETVQKEETEKLKETSEEVKEEPKIEKVVEETKNEEEDFASICEREIEKLKIKIIEKTQTKKKEFSWIGRIENQFGEVEIKLIGKDKKTITDKDILKAFEEATSDKKIVIYLTGGELSKKAKEFYREYKNIVIFQKIN
jgi:hypothetical protein